MRKFVSIVIVLCIGLMVSGCADQRTLGGKSYPAYGFFNEPSNKSKKVCYEVSAGSVIVGIILIETVIVPIYVVGWDLFQPVRLKDEPDDCGSTIDK